MKVFYFFIACLCAFTSQAKSITIKGKITGKLPETLYYTAPVKGTLPFYLNQTAEIKPDGSFTIVTNIDDVTFIDLFYNYQPAGFIVALPGKQYNIVITEKEDKISSAITGDDVALQKLYSTMANTHRMSAMIDLAMECVKLKSAEELKNSLDKRCQADKTAFIKLSKTASLPKNVLDALNEERNYFYATVGGYTMIIKHINADRDPNAPDLKTFQSYWKNIYENYNPKNKQLSKTPWGVYFLDGYKGYENYKKAGFDGKKMPQVQNDIPSIKLSMEIIPTENREYYFASQIYTSLFEEKRDKSIVNTYTLFKQLYPKSAYLKELEPRMELFEAFYAGNNTMPANAAFVDDFEKVNNLAELASKLPGKKLYIDVWATWCGPCREEFKYKEALYKLLKQHDYTVVYISIDKDNKDELWKKTISYYGLQGYHIRANENFDKDIRYHYNDNMSISIPWYLLIDKNGKISKKGAAGASDAEGLKKQLETL